MEIKYRFLDGALKPKTRDLYKNNIEQNIKYNDVSCRCRQLLITVNATDPLEYNFCALIKCSCGRLKLETYDFSVETI